MVTGVAPAICKHLNSMKVVLLDEIEKSLNGAHLSGDAVHLVHGAWQGFDLFLIVLENLKVRFGTSDYPGVHTGIDYRKILGIPSAPLVVWSFDYYQICLTLDTSEELPVMLKWHMYD